MYVCMYVRVRYFRPEVTYLILAINRRSFVYKQLHDCEVTFRSSDDEGSISILAEIEIDREIEREKTQVIIDKPQTTHVLTLSMVSMLAPRSHSAATTSYWPM